MAKTTIEIDVNTGDSVKSLSDLKKDFKDIQKELSGLTPGTEKYIDTLKRLGAVKDDIGDLKDEINAFAGADKKIGAVTNVIGGLASGFQAAQGAAALFGSENEDLQKTLLKVQSAMAFTEGIKGIAGLGDSFKALGNIIKANPLLLIATIIISIGTALFALKDKIAIVGKAFDFLGGILDTVVGAVKDFTDWIGISSFKADEAHKKLMENAEEAKKSINERYDAEIRAAKRAGTETENIEEQRLRYLYLQNFKQIQALQERGKERSNEENKQLIELTKQNKEYYQDLLDLDDAKNDKLKENQKKFSENSEKAAQEKRQKDLTDAEKWRQEQAKFIQYELDAFANKFGEEEQIIAEQQLATKIALGIATPDEVEAYQKEINARKLKAEKEYNDAVDAELKRLKAIEDKRRADEDAKIAAEYALRLEGFKQLELQKVEWAKQGLTLISELNTLFSGQSEAQQKRAFEIDKAVKLSSATISGIEGTINAYSTAQKSPITAVFPAYPAIQAGLAAAFAAVNIAKIAKTKFGGTEKATAPSGGGNLGTFSQGGGGGQPPQGLTAQNTVTQLNPDGTVAGQGNREAAPMKAYVVESESRAVTERVNKLSNNSKIG
jgi:hypothetical protein